MRYQNGLPEMVNPSPRPLSSNSLLWVISCRHLVRVWASKLNDSFSFKFFFQTSRRQKKFRVQLFFVLEVQLRFRHHCKNMTHPYLGSLFLLLSLSPTYTLTPTRTRTCVHTHTHTQQSQRLWQLCLSEIVFCVDKAQNFLFLLKKNKLKISNDIISPK